MPTEIKIPALEQLEHFRMLKAKRKMLNEKSGSMSMTTEGASLREDMNCSSQSPHTAKRACVDLGKDNNTAAEKVNPVAASAWCATSEVSDVTRYCAPRPVNMMSFPPERPGALNGGKIPVPASNLNWGGTFNNWSTDDDIRLQAVLKKSKKPIDWETVALEFCFGRTGVNNART